MSREVLLQQYPKVFPNPGTLRTIPAYHPSPPSYVTTTMIHFPIMRIRSRSLLMLGGSLDVIARLRDHLDWLSEVVWNHNDVANLNKNTSTSRQFIATLARL